MELNPESFNAHLAHMGQTAQWRRAHACPCVNPKSGAASPTCPTCRGKGHFWEPPVASVVGFAGQKTQMAWAQYGRWEDGDVVLSIPSDSPAYAVGRFDRVTMAQGSTPFTAVVMPGERLKFPVLSIDRALRLVNGQPEDVACPSVDAEGELAWPDGQPPGGALSLSGRRSPEYFCWGEYPQDRAFHHGAALPRRVVMRKFDLFGR
jgi:hypothetical protein